MAPLVKALGAKLHDLCSSPKTNKVTGKNLTPNICPLTSVVCQGLYIHPDKSETVTNKEKVKTLSYYGNF